MSNYTIGDVERLLGLSRAMVQGFVEAGFVAPARGEHNELLFAFQDLILLRTAQGLAAVKIPTRKIKLTLARLRADLPETLPLSGIRISALGTRVVVRQGNSQWQADSGQYLLDFDVAPSAGDLIFLKKEQPPGDSAEYWFQRGAELEASDAQAAESAYQNAIARDSGYLAAYLNLGCSLQARGQPAAAERLYREAIRHAPNEPLLHFNLGIALEDMRRPDEAVRAYEQAIALEPEFADAHFNLAKVHESRGQKQEAIRHLASYRRLLRLS
jgi:tetratricopeptide (TPR) repeat protein